MQISGASLIFSGEDYRSIADRSESSFYLSAEIDHSTGVAVFGFSGVILDASGNTIGSGATSFNFNSGQIYDPNSRFVSSYRANQVFNISGNISGTGYDYYIDSAPIACDGIRSGHLIQRFFCHTTGCRLTTTDLKILSPKFDNKFDLSTGFLLSGALTGRIDSLDGASNFKIFNAEITDATGIFQVSGWDTGDNTSSTITIYTTGRNSDETGVSQYEQYRINLRAETNFGNLQKSFTTTCKPAETLTSNFFLYDVDNHENLISGTGYVDSGLYNLFYDLWEEEVYNIESKPLNITFDYESGHTGQFYTVSTVTHLESGTGYSDIPTVVVTGVSGIKPASIIPQMSFMVTGIDITHSGVGYSTTPSLAITGGGGSGAAGTITIYTTGTVSGAVSGIALTNNGSNYTGYPDIIFSGTTGDFNVASPVTGSGAALLGSGVATGFIIDYSGGYWVYPPDMSGVSGGGAAGSGAAASITTSGYEKEFTGYWRLGTGESLSSIEDYYSSNHIKYPDQTGYLNITTGLYTTGKLFSIAVFVHKNYPDSGFMHGKLSVSGRETTIEQIITGVS
jgi:hypothetical protein